MLFYIVGS